jgi:hypothetical protein
MRVLVISATFALASAASAVAGALRDNDVIVVSADETLPARGYVHLHNKHDYGRIAGEPMTALKTY